MKMVITLHTYQLVLPCLLGVEGLVAGAPRYGRKMSRRKTDVCCAQASPEMIARANIRSRFAERVLVLLGTFEAKSFESLFRGIEGPVLDEVDRPRRRISGQKEGGAYRVSS